MLEPKTKLFSLEQLKSRMHRVELYFGDQILTSVEVNVQNEEQAKMVVAKLIRMKAKALS